MHDFKVGDRVVVSILGEGIEGTIHTVGPSDDMEPEAIEYVAYTFMADDGFLAGIPEPIFKDDSAELLA